MLKLCPWYYLQDHLQRLIAKTSLSESKIKLQEVTTDNEGTKLSKALDYFGSDILKIRLSTATEPTNAHAIDVKYYQNCCMTNVENSLSKFSKLAASQTVTTVNIKNKKLC